VSARERDALAGQFGAALDMLERAIDACPASLWGGANDWQAFWYLASHTLWWTDYYLSGDPAGFRPPPPFGKEEMDPDGKLPPRVYAKPELLAHLVHVRARLAAALAALTDERAAAPCGYPRKDFSVLELHAYNLRHVQHHVGQLQLLLRQGGVEPPRWVGRGATG
jgi:hypothetical protein